jgi:2,4-dienoyl-CoA reductase-like NADH-dependent reductase (Old Yellow Enzyme family)
MPDQAHLFSPLKIRDLTLRNRIGVSPMCQYSAEDGFVNDWHFAHLGSRAVGGAGLVMMEATNVSPEGRITPACTGLWKDAHIEPLKRITDFIKKQGAAAGIQLGHAGRKASMQKPWEGGRRLGKEQGGWETLAPSALPFSPELEPPKEMSAADIQKFIADFISAAARAVRAGFQIIELHGAHGYLLHEFLSPLSNKRSDIYGGSLENRCRLALEIAEKIRKTVPQDIILGARLSCVDWLEGGITIDDSVYLAQELKKRGVDFIDCSSGFISAEAKSPFAPGFQVPFAREIRGKTGVFTCAVGLITEAEQADEIIRSGAADMVFLARAMLRDPYWPIHAAQKLGQKAEIPPQYLRAY